LAINSRWWHSNWPTCWRWLRWRVEQIPEGFFSGGIALRLFQLLTQQQLLQRPSTGLLETLLASLQSSAKGLAKTNTLAAGATGLQQCSSSRQVGLPIHQSALVSIE
jgi:hypothetical protein